MGEAKGIAPPAPNSRAMTRTELWEWIALLIAIASLWPVILGYRALWYYGWLVLVLGAMIKVFLNRSARLRRAARPPRDQESGKGP